MKYTTADDLAQYLGREFDDNLNAIADLAIQAAEEIIDQKSPKRYAEVGPQTLTVYEPPSPLVMLPGNGPFSAISVAGYTAMGGASVPLQSGVHYEVRDSIKGVLWFPYQRDYHHIVVTYTPTANVPSRIKLAANILAAHWMRPILNDEVPGLSTYSIGGEFSISFNDHVKNYGYPPEVDMLIGTSSLFIA